VTNDGTDTGGTNPGPFFGDYPHIGADAYGFHITTNAYPWCCNGFSGAQIHALSKAQLAAGAANVTMVHHGAAAADGNSIWIASEYIAGPCTYANWGGPFFVGGTGDNLLGTCWRREPRTRRACCSWQLVDENQHADAVING
jgi:hypothetical protein